MKTSFQARLDILPQAQQYLWPRLSAVNEDFVLYGGTALALRLGHRQSVDFDFFTHRELEPEKILSALPFLDEATVLQSERNTYTFQVPVDEEFVRIFFLELFPSEGFRIRNGRMIVLFVLRLRTTSWQRS